MPLHFGRTTNNIVEVDASGLETPSAVSSAVILGGNGGGSTGAPPTPTKKQTSPPKTPPHNHSNKKISPLQVQIPPLHGDSSNSNTVRPADLVLEIQDLDRVSPPAPRADSSPSSSPSSSAASSPHAFARRSIGTTPTNASANAGLSQMRGLSVLSHRLKQLVSKEKRRFDEDGFNLDLTYVTPRLIAFGYPAENLEGLYRNHYKDIYNFFERRHPARYKIYNLCAERSYDKDKFHHRVAEFPFYDHCPPPLALFGPFCQNVDAWLALHPENVAAIHCKAGKGRTGVMICAYMLYTRMWTTADAAMAFFGAARSLKREGVTIPSQRRFIGYFATLCRQREREEGKEGDEDRKAAKEQTMKAEAFYHLWEETMDGRGMMAASSLSDGGGPPLPWTPPLLPPTTRLVLTAVRISGVYSHKRVDPRVRIDCGMGQATTVYEPLAAFTTIASSGSTSSSGDSPSTAASPSSSRTLRTRTPSPKAVATTPTSTAKDSQFWSTVDMELRCDRLLLWDEVKVSMRHRSGAKIGHFWFHTAFVPAATVAISATATDGDPLELVIVKDEMDKLYKDGKKGHKQFSPDFRVTLVFARATPEDMVTLRASRRTHSTPDAASVAHTPPSPGTPGSPSKLRPWASLNDKRTDGGSMIQFRSSAAASPRRFRAAPPPLTITADGDGDSERQLGSSEAESSSSGHSSSVVAAAAAAAATPSGSRTPASRSVPSSPKAFAMRLFSSRKQEPTD